MARDSCSMCFAIEQSPRDALLLRERSRIAVLFLGDDLGTVAGVRFGPVPVFSCRFSGR